MPEPLPAHWLTAPAVVTSFVLAQVWRLRTNYSLPT